eukprot:790844-Amphidinium_carterae.2
MRFCTNKSCRRGAVLQKWNHNGCGRVKPTIRLRLWTELSRLRKRTYKCNDVGSKEHQIAHPISLRTHISVAKIEMHGEMMR